MKQFPAGIRFKYQWRNYQQRVLNELESHLNDGHLHVIAPPGSGKTVLGLEVMRKLDRPTLILAPSRAIRDQWIHRFCSLFLNSSTIPEWISRDVRNPKFLTVATYQGLHAACSGTKDHEDDDEEVEVTLVQENTPYEKIVSSFLEAGIKTLVLDEAHHLKREWWKTLNSVKERINPVVVGLTATPPYDVTALEWYRYSALNGPVDAEITVPELVIEGDLCPHQDFVAYSYPTQEEHQEIKSFRDGSNQAFEDLSGDERIIEAFSTQFFWEDPLENLEWIYSNVNVYSACLIFLNHNGIEVTNKHLKVIGNRRAQIPELDYDWMSILLDFYIYDKGSLFKEDQKHRRAVELTLQRAGVIEKKQINFGQNSRVSKMVSRSLNKLDSISKISKFESQQLGNGLRLLILSDYIRKEFLGQSSELNRMGVIPIFERLRSELLTRKIGVLTGSLIILPTSSRHALEEKAGRLGLGGIKQKPLEFDPNFIAVEYDARAGNHIVHLVTELFGEGEIEILIGTQSLLGEGWDAPEINALILASFVGSYVLSNQMRGRAIRISRKVADKTANIWHLVCLDSTAHDFGDDYQLMVRRFSGFSGISYDKDEPLIENGFGRIEMKKNDLLRGNIEEMNSYSFELAGQRSDLKMWWDKALVNGVNLVEEIKIPFYHPKPYSRVKSLYFYQTIGNLLGFTGFVWFNYVTDMFSVIRRMSKSLGPDGMTYMLGSIPVIGMLLFGRLTWTSARLYFKYRDISKDVVGIGQAILNTLLKGGQFTTPRESLSIQTTVDKFGCIYSYLDGATTYERSIYLSALEEVLKPISSPRYLIVRKSWSTFFVRQKDFHAVPESIGKSKELATFFRNQWWKNVGDCELVYTRNLEGRKYLLEARFKSLSAQFQHKSERISQWK